MALLLTYQSPPRYASWRNWARRIAISSAVILCLLTAIRVAPTVIDRAQLYVSQRRCASHDYSEGQVVFDPSTVNGTAIVPSCWQQFYTRYSPPGLISRGTVYLHERTSPSGIRRLVALDIEAEGLSERRGFSIVPRLFVSGTMTHRPRELFRGWAFRHSHASYDNARICGGITDPSDRSHFTFVVVERGESHTVDGWLTDGDYILLECRQCKHQ